MGVTASQDQQEKFMHYLSHDLREPVRMVSQFLKLVKLRNENSMDKTSGEYLDYAIDASNKMDKMIKSLSELSRVRDVNEENLDVDVVRIVEDAKERQEVLINLKRASIEYHGDAVIQGKKFVLKEIINELISNSLQHAEYDDQLKIQVRVKTRSNVVHCTVSDNGIALDDFWKQKAFEVFQKRNKLSKNSGVGLTRLKFLMEKCDGKIWIETSESGGTSVNCEF